MSQKTCQSNSWIFSYALLSLQIPAIAAKAVLLATVEASPRCNISHQLCLWLSSWESIDGSFSKDWRFAEQPPLSPALSLWVAKTRGYDLPQNDGWLPMLKFAHQMPSGFPKIWEVHERLNEFGRIETFFQSQAGYPLTLNQVIEKFDTTAQFYSCLKCSLFSFLTSFGDRLVPNVQDQWIE